MPGCSWLRLCLPCLASTQASSCSSVSPEISTEPLLLEGGFKESSPVGEAAAPRLKLVPTGLWGHRLLLGGISSAAGSPLGSKAGKCHQPITLCAQYRVGA